MEFKLRPWRMSDLDALARYANNWSVAKNLTDAFPYPYTRKDGKRFITKAMEEKPTRIFAIEIDGKASGAIGIHPQTDIHRKNAELGYWLAEPFWGQGIVTGAVGEMVDIAFRDPGIERLFARPFGTNKASQKVLEKNGFILEARFYGTLFKKGEYLDELVYAIRRKDWEKR